MEVFNNMEQTLGLGNNLLQKEDIMKKTIVYLFAALAIVTAASCTKEEQIVNEESGNGKIITCSFSANDNVTKTTLHTDGTTPLWAAGDKIMLYDGTSTQELTLATSGTPSSTTGVIDGTSATFTFVRPAGWEEVYAIYPSSACVSGFSASAPKINFAGQDGSFAKANICAGKEKNGTISFNNVGAILKFASKPTEVTDVFIPMQGLKDDYSVSFTDTIPALAPSSSNNIRSYSVGSGTGEIYIGVPAATVAVGSIFLYTDADKTILGSRTMANSKTIVANTVYDLGTISTGTIPTGFIKYAFSICESTVSEANKKKVYFSKGNLYYNGSTWNFEANQYDYRTYAGEESCINGTVTTNGTPASNWGLFGWSTSATTYGMNTSSNNSTYSGDFVDWGNNAIANGCNTANLWRTMSAGGSGDWICLLERRTDAWYKVGFATVAGVHGIIILPDKFTDPKTNTAPGATGGAFSNKGQTGWSAHIYTAGANWNAMEAAGAVFLPAAGLRGGTGAGDVGDRGDYWSSIGSGDTAFCLSFSSFSIAANGAYDRYTGRSVRLVTDAN